jgi:hypothetical protein
MFIAVPTTVIKTELKKTGVIILLLRMILKLIRLNFSGKIRSPDIDEETDGSDSARATICRMGKIIVRVNRIIITAMIHWPGVIGCNLLIFI